MTEGDFNKKILEEKHKIWAKNAPFLYDMVIENELEWPTLTVQWLPDAYKIEGTNYTAHRLLLGSNTTSQKNYLMIGKVLLPENDIRYLDSTNDDENGAEFEDCCSTKGKLDIEIKINHDGSVNRARYMPQNPCLVATKSSNSAVYIYDYTKHPPYPNSDDNNFKPELHLRGHEKGGYGLSWNPMETGYLLSGSDDMNVCLWDIQASTTQSNILEPKMIYKGHNDIVKDVVWLSGDEAMFASVGDDGKMIIWDTRATEEIMSNYIVEAHSARINCLSFSPFSHFVLATGSADKTIALWDLRNVNKKVYSLMSSSSNGEILSVQWSPHERSILASSNTDLRLHVWDINKIHDCLSEEDKNDGPPELLFVHGGHSAKITDFAWNPNEPWIVSSASEDNIMQIWRMAENIHD